ncbi:MAG: pitrilysin family protein [Ignavibacteriales bacterium]|nr:pitrilysin family protein [Ignavibacteriales bacterium]
MKKIILSLCAALYVLTGAVVAQKQVPPEGGKPKDFTLPQKHQFKLPNGMEVTLVPFGAIPKVSVSLVVRSGNLNEGENEVSLADIAGDLMKEGTKSRSADQVDQEAAAMGGNVNIAVGPDLSTISGDVLSEFGPQLVRLMGDIVRNSLFPESELARIKKDAVRQLSVSKAQPQSLALEEFRRMMYPGHPYGRVFPTQEMIETFTIDDVRRFYKENFGAQRTSIYIAGKFDRQAMEAAVLQTFEGWEKGPAVYTNIPKPVTKKSFGLVERPGAPQSTIYVGLPVVNPFDKDYVKMMVTNSLLGGSFASRITSNIREKKGYTYSPTSQVSSRYRDAYWVEIADVGTDVTGAALKEILGEVKRLGSEPPPEDELKGIQNYIGGTFVLQNSTRQGIIGQLTNLSLHGLPDSYLTNYVKNVFAVTPADVQQITQKYIRPDDMTLVIVGDKKKVEVQIKDYASPKPEGK